MSSWLTGDPATWDTLSPPPTGEKDTVELDLLLAFLLAFLALGCQPISLANL